MQDSLLCFYVCNKPAKMPYHNLFYKTSCIWCQCFQRHYTGVCTSSLCQNGAFEPAECRNHKLVAVGRGGGWNYITICEEGKVQIKKDAHTDKWQDTYNPVASLPVISDWLPASASQQLNETLQPPPSQPIDSENPPLAHIHTHTTWHAQSHADTMPIGADLLIDLNSVYSSKGHEDRLLLVLDTEYHDNGLFLYLQPNL